MPKRRAKVEPDLGRLVERLRFSLPVMRMTVTDHYLRNLIITQLIKMNVDDGQATVVPGNALLHHITPEEFEEFRS